MISWLSSISSVLAAWEGVPSVVCKRAISYEQDTPVQTTDGTPSQAAKTLDMLDNQEIKDKLLKEVLTSLSLKYEPCTKVYAP